MEYQNLTSRFLRGAYPITGFDVFVKQRLEQLQRPLLCPPYALQDETEQMDKLNDFIRQDPYSHFERFTVMVNSFLEENQCEMITALSDPVYYECLNICCKALGFDNMVGYVYGADSGYYNAMATGYLDMSWVMVSRTFRRDNLIDDLDLAFLLGHELGHVAAMHTSICATNELDQEKNRNHEYTADKAGLLAVLWKVELKNPDCSPKELYRIAAESCAATMHKLYILTAVKSKEPYTEQTLKLRLADPEYAIPVVKSRRNDSHPSFSERVEALRLYSRTIDFAECVHAMWGREHRAVFKL